MLIRSFPENHLSKPIFKKPPWKLSGLIINNYYSSLNPNLGYPILGIRYPTLGNRYPALGNRYPAPGNRYPAPGNRYPALGNRYPALGNRYPALGNRYPALRNRYPALGKDNFNVLCFINWKKTGKGTLKNLTTPSNNWMKSKPKGHLLTRT